MSTDDEIEGGPSLGHNSVEGKRLKSFVERIERLEEEKKSIADDIKDVYTEAKSTGYDVKVLRRVIQVRKQDRHEREAFEEMLDLYLNSI